MKEDGEPIPSLENIMESDENMPPMNMEISKVNEDKVVTKLFLKGKANHLRNVVSSILEAHIPSSSSSNKTKLFALTLMLEELSKE